MVETIILLGILGAGAVAGLLVLCCLVQGFKDRCPRCRSADFTSNYRDGTHYCCSCGKSWPFACVIF